MTTRYRPILWLIYKYKFSKYIHTTCTYVYFSKWLHFTYVLWVELCSLLWTWWYGMMRIRPTTAAAELKHTQNRNWMQQEEEEARRSFVFELGTVLHLPEFTYLFSRLFSCVASWRHHFILRRYAERSRDYQSCCCWACCCYCDNFLTFSFYGRL